MKVEVGELEHVLDQEMLISASRLSQKNARDEGRLLQVRARPSSRQRSMSSMQQGKCGDVKRQLQPEGGLHGPHSGLRGQTFRRRR